MIAPRLTATTFAMTKKMTLVDKRRNKTRQKLCLSAAKIFVEKGIDATSIEDILIAAEVSRGTFYTYFSDKNDLVKAVTSPVYEFLIEAMGNIDLDNAQQVMEDVIEAYYQCWNWNSDALVLSFVMGSQHFPLIMELHNQFVAKLIAAIEFAAKSGLLRTDDAALTTMLIARTITPTLRALHRAPDFHRLFHESMQGLLLKSSP